MREKEMLRDLIAYIKAAQERTCRCMFDTDDKTQRAIRYGEWRAYEELLEIYTPRVLVTPNNEPTQEKKDK